MGVPVPFIPVFHAMLQAVTSGASSPSGSSTPSRAVFDGTPSRPQEDIYANPPSLISTLQGQLQSDINDPALRCELDCVWRVFLFVSGVSRGREGVVADGVVQAPFGIMCWGYVTTGTILLVVSLCLMSGDFAGDSTQRQ